MITTLNKNDFETLEPGQVQDRLKAIVRESLEELMGKDLDLLLIGAHEQAIFHRLAVYLEKRTPEFHVDCEYNRREANYKYIGKDELIRPDVLIHQRLIQNYNALAVEGKANANPATPKDMRKLHTLAAQQGGFDYQLGASIRIHNGIDDLLPCRLLTIEVTWVIGNSRNPARVPEQNPFTQILNDTHVKLVEARPRKRPQKMLNNNP